MPKAEAIGDRLREWGLERYGSVKAFAEALGIVSEGLSPYLNNRRQIGGKMERKLRALGCDIEWLMTGERKGSGSDPREARIHRIFEQVSFSMEGMSEEQRERILKMVDRVKEADTEELEEILHLIEIYLRKSPEKHKDARSRSL